MRKKPKPEIVWMAWSPASNFLPQAASVSRSVCRAMIKERGFSKAVKAIRVKVSAAKPVST
jgi:hypothetical protein